MKIGILLYDNFTMLDAMGPYEVLTRIPNAEVIFTGFENKEYKDQFGTAIKIKQSIQEFEQLDVLLIPGGFGIDDLLTNNMVIDWVKKIDSTSQWTTSVCSGALLLAHAGLLSGRQCTTHWNRREQLAKYNVKVGNIRYIQDGKYITSAGVSAGIDMALFLVAKIAGDTAAKMIQLGIEYDPQPPFDCGSIEKVPAELLAKLKK